MKKVNLKAKPAQPSPDEWVSAGGETAFQGAETEQASSLSTQQQQDSPTSAQTGGDDAQAGTMKRLTIDIPDDLHKRIKMQCAARGSKMADEIRLLLEDRFPVGH